MRIAGLLSRDLDMEFQILVELCLIVLSLVGLRLRQRELDLLVNELGVLRPQSEQPFILSR